MSRFESALQVAIAHRDAEKDECLRGDDDEMRSPLRLIDMRDQAAECGRKQRATRACISKIDDWRDLFDGLGRRMGGDMR